MPRSDVGSKRGSTSPSPSKFRGRGWLIWVLAKLPWIWWTRKNSSCRKCWKVIPDRTLILCAGHNCIIRLPSASRRSFSRKFATQILKPIRKKPNCSTPPAPPRIPVSWRWPSWRSPIPNFFCPQNKVWKISFKLFRSRNPVWGPRTSKGKRNGPRCMVWKVELEQYCCFVNLVFIPPWSYFYLSVSKSK